MFFFDVGAEVIQKKMFSGWWELGGVPVLGAGGAVCRGSWVWEGKWDRQDFGGLSSRFVVEVARDCCRPEEA